PRRRCVTPVMATLTLTNENHDKTVEDGIVLIDFWAGWCVPCQRFAPIFEESSETHEDVTFAKVDTEDQQELAMRYGITSIPTLVAYREGNPVFSQAGALPQSALEDLIGQIRNLDMDEVRKAYAEAQETQQQGCPPRTGAQPSWRRNGRRFPSKRPPRSSRRNGRSPSRRGPLPPRGPRSRPMRSSRPPTFAREIRSICSGDSAPRIWTRAKFGKIWILP